jgi:hypothetical protein
MSQRERPHMATNETAKPCPLTERKKSKVVILKEVLGWAAILYRMFNLVDGGWNWIKDHWNVIRDWFGDFL